MFLYILPSFWRVKECSIGLDPLLGIQNEKKCKTLFQVSTDHRYSLVWFGCQVCWSAGICGVITRSASPAAARLLIITQFIIPLQHPVLRPAAALLSSPNNDFAGVLMLFTRGIVKNFRNFISNRTSNRNHSSNPIQ